ncbi:ABC transporter substrate-binding protein [Cryobacterium sp. Hh7]|uniref:ABC transporter substrate-binding protein n=1 Tax=Cryobacterium sp. Hh7 TaxID=1259159 RepID=UPI0010697899|nr:ABC transporter substrate-binding protein [Cryobacterium sp. Hh7]TFD49884.1 ABC transporter substrate-binding protein [Cryobacterium sp. Hh7]
MTLLNRPIRSFDASRISRSIGTVALSAAALLLLTSCAAATDGAAAENVLTVGSDLTYPPYAFLEGDTPAGFDPDITLALAEAMDMTVTYEDTRFEQLIAGIKSERFDVIASALYITKERAAEVDYIPYFSTGNSIVVAAGASPLTTIPDLCGKVVAVIKGGDIVQRLRVDASADCVASGAAAVDVREFTTDPEGTQALLSGQVDAQLTDAGVASTLESATDNAVHISSTALLYPIPVGLAVKKGNSDLADKLLAALESMKADGSYDALLSEYNLAEPDAAQVAQILGN